MPVIPEVAIRQHLQGLTAIEALVEERVYEVQLPTNVFKTVKTIPKTILIMSLPGGTATLLSPRIQPNLLIRCYGEDFEQAYDVYLAVYAELHGLTNQAILPEGNIIISGEVATLGQTTMDPMTGWKFVHSTWAFDMTNL